MQQLIPVILGPTASGKTEAAINLAKAINGALISVDSRQCYREVDIISGRGRLEKLNPYCCLEDGVEIYCYDFINPDEQINVTLYYKKVLEALEIIIKSGKNPILVGGTAFYMEVIVGQRLLDSSPTPNHIREKFATLELKELFIEASKRGGIFNQSDSQNPYRLRRFLEKIETSKLSSGDKIGGIPNANFILTALCPQNEIIFQRSQLRLEKMLDDGLLPELSSLVAKYSSTAPAISAIGAKEFLPVLKGTASLEAAIILKLKNEKEYIKRQKTFLKRFKNLKTFESDEELVMYLLTQLQL